MMTDEDTPLEELMRNTHRPDGEHTVGWLVWLAMFTVLAVVTAVVLGAPHLLADWWHTLTGTNVGVR